MAPRFAVSIRSSMRSISASRKPPRRGFPPGLLPSSRVSRCMSLSPASCPLPDTSQRKRSSIRAPMSLFVMSHVRHSSQRSAHRTRQCSRKVPDSLRQIRGPLDTSCHCFRQETVMPVSSHRKVDFHVGRTVREGLHTAALSSSRLGCRPIESSMTQGASFAESQVQAGESRSPHSQLQRQCPSLHRRTASKQTHAANS